MSRWLGLLSLMLFVLLGQVAMADTLYVSPLPLCRGQAVLVKACVKDKNPGRVEVGFQERRTLLDQGRGGCWYAAVAVPLSATAGMEPMRLFVDGRQTAGARLKIVSRDYGVRRITVSKKFNKLSPEDLAKYQRDTAAILAVYDRYTPTRYWRGAFKPPVPGVVVSKYGRRSVVNGVEKSPHSGVDLRGADGTPVVAPADGRVALVLDHYFAGNTLLIDHGQGLVSSYLHLSRVLVKQDQEVHQGQVIAEVGSTGRVTGPHLHYGVTLGGVKTDPLAWQALSARLAGDLEGK